MPHGNSVGQYFVENTDELELNRIIPLFHDVEIVSVYVCVRVWVSGCKRVCRVCA